MSSPLKPPVEGHVLRVARWPEVFETAHSRKHKVLTWISVPINFNSTGYQKLLDEFPGIEGAAIYGAWNALCQLAAQPKDKQLRGKLCGSKGELYNTRRVARLTGLPIEAFELLIPWAIRIGWLQWAAVDEPWPSNETGQENSDSEDDSEPILKVGIDDSEIRTLPNPTQPNLTKPNPTPPKGKQPERERERGKGKVSEDKGQDKGQDEWRAVAAELQAAGVGGHGKAIVTARGNGWTPAHALAVVAAYNANLGAWSVAQLYGRFQLAAAIEPNDGWPDPSPEWRKTRKATALAERLKRESDELAAATRAKRARKASASEPVSFGPEIQRLAKLKASAGTN